jgi:23S rRNA (adenine2503-C2)-methyltransferase
MTSSSAPLTLLPAAPGRKAPDGAALPNIYDYTPEELVEVLHGWDQPRYRAKQITQWLYKELVTSFDAMTNVPLDLRRRLAGAFRLGSVTPVTELLSRDNDTRKILYQFADGNTVETVLMLYYERATVCVSSQVGCAMGCVFCATGQMGFTRNLSAGEIVEQVLGFSRWLRQHPYQPPARPAPGRDWRVSPDEAEPMRQDHRPSTQHTPRNTQHATRNTQAPEPISGVTNIVFMGMGEPFVNYDNLMKAIRILNSPDGLALGARRLTVSTVGVVPRIRRFTREPIAVNLAVSLHAPNDELRSRLVPLNQRYPLAEVMDACREYVAATGRRITYEYALIAGENDSLGCAHELAALLKGQLCHVNLIPLNPIPGTSLRATPREQVQAFAAILTAARIPTTVRIERGQDIAAACGQLKIAHEPHSHQRSLNPAVVTKE